MSKLFFISDLWFSIMCLLISDCIFMAGLKNVSFLLPHYTKIKDHSIHVSTTLKRILSRSRHYSGDFFLQQTTSKKKWESKFWNMGFWQNRPIYETHGEFTEKGEPCGIFSWFFEHVFFKLQPTHLSVSCLFLFFLFKH